MEFVQRGARGSYRVHFGMRCGIVRGGNGVCSFGNYPVVANDDGGERTAVSGFDILCRQLYCLR